jgi:hypothetical protein
LALREVLLDMDTAEGSEERKDQYGADASAKDAQELVEKLRSAPAEQMVTEAFFMLLNGAQVKLGRRDARLLIDLSTVMLDYARQYLSEPLVKQVEQSLDQLRLGQVSAEKTVVDKGDPEPNDLSQAPTPPSTSSGHSAPAT